MHGYFLHRRGGFGRQWFADAPSSWKHPGRATLRNALTALGVVFCSTVVLADEKPVLKLTTPATAIRLLGAHCPISCWFSSLFAPGVVRDNVAAVQVTNASKAAITIAADFVSTNETFGAGGLADYAALFLAGVASEAIAGGLRTVKYR